MTGCRIAGRGEGIDPAKPVSFTYDGRDYRGFAGDTLASALLASGVTLFARSFKYHRPRGVLSAGPEEPSALVTVIRGDARDANIPATMVEIHDGLVAESQNRWPTLGFDLMSVNGMLAPYFAAGFYYKTFMWPKSFWEKVYEPLIRRAAGLGKASTGADPDTYETISSHCDVLVIGAGLAGLAAARVAAEAGARVLLLEQDREPGGGCRVDGALAAWRDDTLAAIFAAPEAIIRTRTTAIGAYDSGLIAALERVTDHLAEAPAFTPRQRLHLIRPRFTILATGTVERLIAFEGNDKPGVMLTSAARTYLRRFGVLPGRNVAFFVNNDEAYAAIRDIRAAGADIAAVIDPRDTTPIIEDAISDGIPVLVGSEVRAATGFRDITGVIVRPRAGGATRRIACDLLCLSGGYTPQVQLATQAGNAVEWRDQIAGFAALPGKALHPAGAAAGAFGRREAATDGIEVARAALSQLGFSPGETSRIAPNIAPRRDGAILPLWEVIGRAGSGAKSFVDLQHDVTAADLRLAEQEGYSSIEHAKRYTTHGMGTDQGKTGGLLGAAILAEARGEPVSAVGVSKPRPFVVPVSWGALAGPDVGAHFKPERRLPLHDWHQSHGAVFVRIGLWMRPLVYSPSGDTSWRPVLEEARATRRSVGITDASSLGKLDVQGRDAARFLDLVYANSFSTLGVGRARYGLMLREDGIVLDDGTTSRLGEDHFLLTTTTGQSQTVLEHLEFHHQVVWPHLDVRITNVADHWAQFAIAGPKARAVLQRVVSNPDLSNEAFPFMAAGEAVIAGVRGRLFRISFSGELAYEVAVPAGFARHVWEAILDAGRADEVRPYGLDALNVMRIEKGHVAGSELNGQASAADLCLGTMLKKNRDFIGKSLVEREGLQNSRRLQLVGIQPVDPRERLRNGAHLVSRAEPRRSQGYLTAACMASEGSHDWIGLAMLEGGHRRIGEVMLATSPVHGETVEVEIVSHHRLDPENKRVRA